MDDMFKRKARGCLAGLAIGDALGMPVETLTPEEIRAATGGEGVRGFIAPIQTRFGTTRLPARSTTDDTQLALAIARSIIRTGRFDPADQARVLAAEFRRPETQNKGWGRATKEAAAAFAAWFESNGAKGRSPFESAPEPEVPGAGCGNGVAMKVAPLAIYAAASGSDDVELMRWTAQLGRMTHGDPRATHAAIAVAAAIAELLRPHATIVREPDTALYHVRKTMMSWIEMIETLEPLAPPRARLSDKLHAVWEICGRASRARQDEREAALLKLRRTIGTACYALESVPFAIGVFLCYPLDFGQGVLAAVNAGGDTDTTAAIVGALIGANGGLGVIPTEWTYAVPDCVEAIDLASILAGIS